MGTSATLGRGRLQDRSAALAGSSGVAVAVFVLCIVAAVARLRVFAARRSLWFDEAAVAMNIVQRSFGDLLRPLDHEQTAAPLFLWGERVAYLIGGNTEWALRALPLIAGLVLPVAMWSVAKRLLPAIDALIAVALVALSPFLIYYANEVKPYGIDAAVTTLMLAAALRVAERPDARGRWVALALGGALAIGLSIPAPFVLAAVAVYLASRADVRRAAGVRAHAALTVVVWACAAALALMVYLPVMSHTSFIGSFMQHFWGGTFLTTEPPGLKERALNAVAGATRATFFDGVIWWQQVNLLMVIAIAGLVRIAKERGISTAMLFVVPGICLVVAAALRMYPLGDRLILFAAPLTALLLTAGITWPAHVLRGEWRALATAGAGALLLAVPASRAFAGLRHPPGRSETREMIHEVLRARETEPRPVVWLSAGSVKAWRYYAGPMEDPNVARTAGAPLPQPDSIAPGILVGKWPQSAEGKSKGDWGMWELDRIRRSGGECGWMLLSVLEPDERSMLMDAIRRSNTRIDASRVAPGAELLRVCFPATPNASASGRG